MKFPDRITGNWIDALTDIQLQDAERTLHKRFAKEEKAERTLRGGSFDMMRGPETLTAAWMKWSMVNSAARLRGLRALR